MNLVATASNPADRIMEIMDMIVVGTVVVGMIIIAMLMPAMPAAISMVMSMISVSVCLVCGWCRIRWRVGGG